MRQARPDHLARVDRSGIHGATEQFLEGQHPVAVVQEEAGKHLVGQVDQTLRRVLARERNTLWPPKAEGG